MKIDELIRLVDDLAEECGAGWCDFCDLSDDDLAARLRRLALDLRTEGVESA